MIKVGSIVYFNAIHEYGIVLENLSAKLSSQENLSMTSCWLCYWFGSKIKSAPLESWLKVIVP